MASKSSISFEGCLYTGLWNAANVHCYDDQVGFVTQT